MGIDTYQEPVLYMREDCPVCRSEGFESQSRVQVTGNNRSLIATVHVVTGDLLPHGQAGLSESGWSLLGSDSPCEVELAHPAPVESFRHIRSKLFGHELSPRQLGDIVQDITNHRYSDVQLSAFLASCVGERMSTAEVIELTNAMVVAGKRIDWGATTPVYDKHCVGGLPGNRTTPIVVAIVTACGMIMPKTSSRAITSPAGTADVMQTMTNVDLSLAEMRQVVEHTGGCLVWGGAVELSPADDLLIRVERALDLDSEAQLVASVLSKKIAAGSTHVLIDIPTGPTAKVRDAGSANRIARQLEQTGDALGIHVDTVVTDGSAPVGWGIGPALEARDVLAVLRGDSKGSQDLRDRALFLAGCLLEQSVGDVPGYVQAAAALNDGRAWRQFQSICEAQGRFSEPTRAAYCQPVEADRDGIIASIDNRRIAKVAKLAGAPTDVGAGVELHALLGERVEQGAPVMTVHADAPGELQYALDYLAQQPDLIGISDNG